MLPNSPSLFSSQSLKWLISIAIGALTTLGFSPFDYGWIAPITLAIYVALLAGAQTPKQSALIGLCFGLGLFGTGISWVYVSIHLYGNTSEILAALFTAGFVLVLALFNAAQAYTKQRWFSGNSSLNWWLGFPAIFVFYEWLRGWILTGFPWLYMGYTQTDQPLDGYAPILTVYGVSFITCVCGVALFMIGKQLISRNYTQVLKSLSILVSVMIIGVLLKTISWTTINTNQPIEVALIQGNIPQEMKWLPEQRQNIMKLYAHLSRAHQDADIIIWPENAIPIFKDQVQSFLLSLDQESKKNHNAIILGLPIDNPTTKAYYNGLTVIGEGHGDYYKHHLVPFGEYVPLDRWLRGVIDFFNIPMSNFSAGSKNQSLLEAKGKKIAPYICYEIAYPRLVLRQAKDADLLITVSDDSWFGKSIGPHQHLQIAQFRALETGRYLLRATNTGYTAVINPKGEVIAEIPPFTEGVLTAEVYSTTGRTPAVWMGISGPIGLCVLIILWLGWRNHKLGRK